MSRSAVPKPSSALIVTLGVLQFVIEMLVVRHYAMAVTFITALVLLISERPGHVDLTIVADRVFDTVIGATVALAVLWSTGRRFDARVLPYEVRRTNDAIRHLATVLETQAPTTLAAAHARRTVQIELLESAAAADVAYRHARAAAHAFWQAYTRSQNAGYDLLAHCWTHGHRQSAVSEDLRARIAEL